MDGKHASPNSGWPEAAMAGALQIQLGGMNMYDGMPVERPKLGDAIAALNPSLIPLAVQLMILASGLVMIILLAMLEL